MNEVVTEGIREFVESDEAPIPDLLRERMDLISLSYDADANVLPVRISAEDHEAVGLLTPSRTTLGDCYLLIPVLAPNERDYGSEHKDKLLRQLTHENVRLLNLGHSNRYTQCTDRLRLPLTNNFPLIDGTKIIIGTLGLGNIHSIMVHREVSSYQQAQEWRNKTGKLRKVDQNFVPLASALEFMTVVENALKIHLEEFQPQPTTA